MGTLNPLKSCSQDLLNLRGPPQNPPWAGFEGTSQIEKVLRKTSQRVRVPAKWSATGRAESQKTTKRLDTTCRVQPNPHWSLVLYSGVPHIRFPFGGEGSLWILGFGVPSKPNPSSGALKSALPGPREGSSILNAHLMVMSAAVIVWSH